MIEAILEDYRSAYGFSSCSLRYFNVAGADLDDELGELHQPESQLIPLLIQAALGLYSDAKVYGSDCSTRDGTCARDYVHVTDLCSVYLLALERLLAGGRDGLYDLGIGKGYSVKEVIDSVIRISGVQLKVSVHSRRAGDPAVLVADTSKAKNELGWKPKYDDPDIIMCPEQRFLKKHYA